MRCAISVLVNLSQNSQAGCEQLLGCGAVGTVLDLITLVVQDGGLDEGEHAVLVVCWQRHG